MNRAIDRKVEGYTETHHVTPRCMGGDNSKTNLVELYPEEHYTAHQLLVKIYPKNYSLVYAAIAMSMSNTFVKRINNKLYGWLRRRFSDSQKGDKNHRYGKKPHNFGIHLSQEKKDHLSRINMGKKLPQSTKDKMSLRMMGNTHGKGHSPSLENRKKASERNKGNIYAKGIIHTEEYRKNMSLRVRGANHHNAKLTENDIIEIRLSNIYGVSNKDIKSKYNLTACTFHDITHWRSWRHVHFPEY